MVDKFSFHNYDQIDNNEKIDPIENRMMVKSNLTFELVWAAGMGDISEVRKSVALGADVNKGDYDNRTALHLAAAEGQENVVKYLLDKGADPNAKDRWKLKPIDDAKINNHDSIVEILNSEMK